MDTAAIASFAKLVTNADAIAVLTGAGISTPSGIPDFRSAGGIYSNEANQNVFDIWAFQDDPGFFYKFAHDFYPLVANAEPNAAHKALAAWEQRGMNVRIATQNIDDLHERAGSRHVYYVHGSIKTSSCQACWKQIDSREILPNVLEGSVPRCDCGGVVKPDVTFFGESLPREAWDRSAEAMAGADLVIVIGTSLLVQPAASLPDFRRRFARLVIVNRNPTRLDRDADLVLCDDLAEVFAEVEAILTAGT